MADYPEAINALAEWIAHKRQPGELFRVGIGGAQGSGKSTVARSLEETLGAMDIAPCVLRLDDFYKTQVERARLAREIHPLLQVRGVPGTHDMALLRAALAMLVEGKEVMVPVFDKARDDRVEKPGVVDGKRDVVIVEGWCWGAAPAAEDELEAPINELEAHQDADGTWRRYVNNCLASDDYQVPFRSTDALVFLQVPDMEAVYRWRLQQERELAQRGQGDRIMDEAQVREFIMHYERITRRMLHDTPDRADVTVRLNDEHGIDSIRIHE